MKKIFAWLYKMGLLVLLTYFIYLLFGKRGFSKAFFLMAFWIPLVDMSTGISAHLDLLSGIKEKGKVDIRARAYDFIHWLMLISITVGIWMIDRVTIGWFFMALVLLSIIGWQIGIGVKKYWHFTRSDKIAGLIASVVAVALGFAFGFARFSDKSMFGYGWAIEIIGSVVATVVVLKWILLDIKQIRKDPSGYPRSFFVKGVLSNALTILFWLSIIFQPQKDMSFNVWQMKNIAFSFNVIVGNILFWIYWGIYEVNRKRLE